MRSGDKAPYFSLFDGNGNKWSLDDHLGKTVVLLFYPGDNTPVCTAQLCSVRDHWSEYQATGAEVVGISTDSVESHKGFAEKNELPLKLLADTDGEVSKKYGMRSWLPGRSARGVVVIDKEGRIAYSKAEAISLFRPKDDDVLAAIQKQVENMGKMIAALLAIVGWLSLILQFVLHMNNPVIPEPGTAERFVRFFSYFTVSTNIIVAVTLTAIAFFPLTRFGAFFSRPSVQTAVASYISIVGIVYSLFLRTAWDPQGWQAVADHLLHDAMPLAFVIYWLVFAPKHGITWNAPIKWLGYPVVYIVYSLIRGSFVSWYPYWFVDVTQLGYSASLRNTAFVLVAFAATGFIYAGIAKVISRIADTGK